MERMPTWLRAGLIGLVAGLASGLLGVGGGIVMVPLLVWAFGSTQHRAHATSLAAIVPIAIFGALRFAVGDAVDLAYALPLAAGAVIGAPLGARVMHRTPEPQLKVAFGALTAMVGVIMVLT